MICRLALHFKQEDIPVDLQFVIIDEGTFYIFMNTEE